MTLAANLNSTPFEVMAQDVDEIIMLINYYIIIAETASESSGAPQASDKAAAKSFWAAL